MLNFGEKNFALCATKKINILTLVLSEKKFLNETKNHNPPPPPPPPRHPLQVKWSVTKNVAKKERIYCINHVGFHRSLIGRNYFPSAVNSKKYFP